MREGIFSYRCVSITKGKNSDARSLIRESVRYTMVWRKSSYSIYDRTLSFNCSDLLRVFIYPMLIRGGKHSSYLTTIMAFIFCSLNSYAIAQEILAYHTYPPNYLFSARFLIGRIDWLMLLLTDGVVLGTAVFFTGFFLNLQADSILRNLRKDDSDREYKIPRGNFTQGSECILMSSLMQGAYSNTSPVPIS